jgi:GDP-D-mannose dehydratase
MSEAKRALLMGITGQDDSYLAKLLLDRVMMRCME